MKTAEEMLDELEELVDNLLEKMRKNEKE